MGFSGRFEMVTSPRGYNARLWSFVLTCNNLLRSETVDCMISDARGQNPFFFRDQTFSPRTSYRFDYDTVDWMWYNDDFFAIIDHNNRILERWDLKLKVYGPGECPSCHGTKKCRRCNGEGFVYPKGKLWEFQNCPDCGGTGVCQTCEVPIRKPRFGGPPTGIGNGFK